MFSYEIFEILRFSTFALESLVISRQARTLLNFLSFFKSEGWKFPLPKYKKFLQGGFFFFFLSLESYFLEYKKVPFLGISWILSGFPFPGIYEKLSFEKI